MFDFSGSLSIAAEIAGLLLAAVVAGKLYRHFYYARVSVDLLPPSSESYVHTPGTADKANGTNSGSRQLSHSQFRLRLSLFVSHKVQLRGAVLYAYHRDMARPWAELSPISLPVLSNEEAIHASVQDFVKCNSRDSINDSVILDNGIKNYAIELNSNERREMVIARLGGFILPLPERGRQINGTNYCDVLLRLNINAVAVALLVCVPRYDPLDQNGPIITDFKLFRRAKTMDVLTWAAKARPDPGAEGARRGEKFWLELRKS